MDEFGDLTSISLSFGENLCSLVMMRCVCMSLTTRGCKDGTGRGRRIAVGMSTCFRSHALMVELYSVKASVPNP